MNYRPGTHKHTLPAVLPGREDADFSRLVIKPGPWTAEKWAVVPGIGDQRRSGGNCAVSSCDGASYLSPSDVNLCQPHYTQWWRAGSPSELQVWLSQAKAPIRRTRRNSVAGRVIDFAELPPLIALEMRFVVGEKVTAGDWTPNRSLLDFLTAFVATVLQAKALSLLDRRPEDWSILVQQHVIASFRIDAASYARTFFVILHRALVVDPWEADSWLWRHGFERLVHENSGRALSTNIHWGKIHQEWLRKALKTHARNCLSTGSRSWSTVVTWADSMARFSEYLDEEGIVDPEQVDRPLLIDYLVYLNQSGASKHSLAGANIVASLLTWLQVEGIAPALGSEVFLRHGENAVKKVREPKPYPVDIIHLVDTKILFDKAVDPSARLMLQLTRWGGFRISELVACPIDCLRHNGKNGYWIQYYMPKTKSERAFPLPDDLAQILLAQQKLVRSTYGNDAEYLFPSPARSNPSANRVQPWSASGFRNHIRAAFERHGITVSSVTGEIVSGGEIHRYRHTIGTALLNNGWTTREVMEFLGHATEAMTASYAKILDETLVLKVREFRTNQLAIDSDYLQLDNPGVERLRARFAYELPDGGCTLPADQSCDIRDNPCSGCAFFDGGGEAMRPIHEDRQKRLKLHIAGTTNEKEIALNKKALEDVDNILREGSKGAS